jgi:aminoglycoside phosphotransferase family enzyme
MQADVIDQLLASMAIDEFMEFMSELFPDLIDDLAMQAMKQAWIDLEEAEAHRVATAMTHSFDWQENSVENLEASALLHWFIATQRPFRSKIADQLADQLALPWTQSNLTNS